MASIRVVLADDHTLVRAGLYALLQTMPGIHVVAEANDGHEAMALIRTHQPDVVLMDIAMPVLTIYLTEIDMASPHLLPPPRQVFPEEFSGLSLSYRRPVLQVFHG